MSLEKYIGIRGLDRGIWDAFVRAVAAEVKALRTDVDANKVVAQAVAARGLQVIEDYLSPLIEDAGDKRDAIGALLVSAGVDIEALITGADGDMADALTALAMAVAQIEAQRDAWLAGILDASAVAETADRKWLTPDERTAIAGAASSASVTSAISSAIAALINGAGADRDTLGEIATALTSLAATVSGLSGGGGLAGFLSGMVPSNATGDPDHDVTISAGVAVTGGKIVTLASAMTKRLDAGWSVGDNGGGLDAGALAANTWYYGYVIASADGATVDIVWSTSASAPTLPNGYTLARRVATAYCSSSGVIERFIAFAVGSAVEYRRKTPSLDFGPVSQGAGYTTRSIKTPTSLTVRAFGMYSVVTTSVAVKVRAVGALDGTPSAVAAPGALWSANTYTGAYSDWEEIAVNGQIETGTSGSTSAMYLTTERFVDGRVA